MWNGDGGNTFPFCRALAHSALAGGEDNLNPILSVDKIGGYFYRLSILGHNKNSHLRLITGYNVFNRYNEHKEKRILIFDVNITFLEFQYEFKVTI